MNLLLHDYFEKQQLNFIAIFYKNELNEKSPCAVTQGLLIKYILLTTYHSTALARTLLCELKQLHMLYIFLITAANIYTIFHYRKPLKQIIF